MDSNEKFSLLKKEFLENKNSHAIIFNTNNIEKCKKDVNDLISFIFGNNKITENSDVVIIKKNDKGKILKEDILQLRDFFQTTSIYNKNRVYLIEEVHKLNASSANLILKFLEEPLEGVIALFITTNLDAVLPTIKSRCQIETMIYDQDEEISADDYNTVCMILHSDKNVYLFKSKKEFESYDRSDLINLFNNYLNFCYNSNNLNDEIKNIKKITRAISMLNNNVNTDYVFDYLYLESE